MWETRTMLLLGLMVMLGYQIQPSGGLRILALFPSNSASHNAMCDRLARELAAKGHQIDVYSHFPPEKPIANYQSYSLAGTLPPLTNNMTFVKALLYASADTESVLDEVATKACELMRQPIFRKLIKDPPSYDLVIVEAYVADCYFAWGRHLKVPMVGLMTTPLMDWYNEALGNPFNTAVTPYIGIVEFERTNFWHRLNNIFSGSYINFKLIWALSYQNELVKSYFGPGYPDINELRRDLDLLIVNTHHSLDGVRAYTPAIIPAAGMHINDEDDTPIPQDVQQWLDEAEHGCVYFSFGSMVRIETFPLEILQAFYGTFKNIAPVRVLLKIANPEDLYLDLPPNVMIKSWFPQMQILKHKHVKAFVTHGGLMSTLEAIYNAVPLVGIPIFGDQFANIEIIVKKGTAKSVKLQTINEQEFTEAIKDVLYNSSYKLNMEKLSKAFIDRPMKPLDTAVYWVEYVGRHGKNCLRSPLVDMPWWQANLLDVYALICLIIVSGFPLKFIKFIIKLPFRMFGWQQSIELIFNIAVIFLIFPCEIIVRLWAKLRGLIGQKED